jgi:hypothetical protein
MVATYVYSLTVASMRKAAKKSGVKQSITPAQMRGLLFSAAASRVKSSEAWQQVLGEE